MTQEEVDAQCDLVSAAADEEVTEEQEVMENLEETRMAREAVAQLHRDYNRIQEDDDLHYNDKREYLRDIRDEIQQITQKANL